MLIINNNSELESSLEKFYDGLILPTPNSKKPLKEVEHPVYYYKTENWFILYDRLLLYHIHLNSKLEEIVLKLYDSFNKPSSIIITDYSDNYGSVMGFICVENGVIKRRIELNWDCHIMTNSGTLRKTEQALLTEEFNTDIKSVIDYSNYLEDALNRDDQSYSVMLNEISDLYLNEITDGEITSHPHVSMINMDIYHLRRPINYNTTLLTPKINMLEYSFRKTNISFVASNKIIAPINYQELIEKIWKSKIEVVETEPLDPDNIIDDILITIGTTEHGTFIFNRIYVRKFLNNSKDIAEKHYAYFNNPTQSLAFDFEDENIGFAHYVRETCWRIRQVNYDKSNKMYHTLEYKEESEIEQQTYDRLRKNYNSGLPSLNAYEFANQYLKKYFDGSLRHIMKRQLTNLKVFKRQ